MKKTLLTVLIFFSVFVSFSQIGNTSITFTDNSRNGRSIPCEIYYPAATTGTDVAASTGVFPVVAVGHGFVIGASSYELVATELVPQGFIVALVNTEGGFAPSHGDFGLDLSFVTHAIQAEGNNSSSILFGHVHPSKEAVLGHSMGGGASWLAAGVDSEIDAVVGLAPAETNPSAIAAAANVQCPVLLFSGSDDTVTPAADNHTPIFEASASACKYFINLVGGSHCGFIPAGSLCDFGEPLGGSLSRANQQAAYLSLTNIWLRQVLKSECTEAEWQSALQQYNFAESNSNTLNCLPCVSVNEFSQGALEIFPNPVQNKFVISGIPTGVNFLYVRNMHGQCIEVIRVNGQSQIEMQSTLESGVYFIDFENNFGQNRINKFVVLK